MSARKIFLKRIMLVAMLCFSLLGLSHGCEKDTESAAPPPQAKAQEFANVRCPIMGSSIGAFSCALVRRISQGAGPDDSSPADADQG